MYVTKEQIEAARNVDMVEFLARTEGYNVKQVGSQYRCDIHDSLIIMQDRKGWYWNSQDKGGNNAIAYLMRIHGRSFTEAVAELTSGRNYTYNYKPAKKPAPQKEQAQLILPEQDHFSNGQRNYSNMIAYLCKTRGIDYAIVNQLIYDRRLYQGVSYTGLRLLGYDENCKAFYKFADSKPLDAPEYVYSELTPQKNRGEKYTASGFSADEIPALIEKGIIKKNVSMIAVTSADNIVKYAFCRSCNDASKYRIDIPGSDKAFSFSLKGNDSSTVYVYEAVIDLLSHATMENLIKGSPSAWVNTTRVSLAGTSDLALDKLLLESPETKTIVLCVDNDEAGIHTRERLFEKYTNQGYTVKVEQPILKDCNDDLKAFLNLPEAERKSRISRLR